jgi:hypothetical protein
VPAPSYTRRHSCRAQAASVTNPTNGGGARSESRDVRIITTVDEHPGGVLTDDWGVAVSPRHRESAVCARCGAAVAGGESDPSLMVGVVLLLVANTLVIAALVAAVVWIVA